MIEPDFTYETHISTTLDTATQNLSQNLHLKWQYALLFLDRYSDEQGFPVSVVSGLFRQSENKQFHLRATLSENQKGTHLRVHVWYINTNGWPFPEVILNTAIQNKELGVDLIDNVISFCRTPYENTGSIFSWLRNMFSSAPASRKYKKS